MNLADLIFRTDVGNAQGFPNITGPELAALLKAATGAPGPGALVEASAVVTLDVQTVTVNFTTVHFDDLGFFNSGDPERFTIPAGVSRVALWTAIQWGNTPSAGLVRSFHFINGGGFGSPGLGLDSRTGAQSPFGPLVSYPSGQIVVVPGDFLSMAITQNSGGNRTALEVQFGITVLG